MTTETVEVPPDVWGRAVEAFARAEHDFDCDGLPLWDEASESIRADYLASTRVGMAAALPVLLADLAERIETQANLGPEHWDSGVEFATGLVRSFAAEVSR